MRAYSSHQFVLPLPPGHRFPMRKYERLQEELLARRVLQPGDIHEPHAATDAELGHAHAPDYIARVAHNQLTESELRRIGFPWTEAMVQRSRRSTGATLDAARTALNEGVAANLAGGTHHACHDHGEIDRFLPQVGELRDVLDHQGDHIPAYLLFEEFRHESLLVPRELLLGDQEDLLLAELLHHLQPDAVELALLLENQELYLIQDLLGRIFEMLAGRGTELDHAPECGYAHAEEFVQVVREDAQETYALLQGHVGVGRLLQYAGVEGQPADVPGDGFSGQFGHGVFYPSKVIQADGGQY